MNQFSLRLYCLKILFGFAKFGFNKKCREATIIFNIWCKLHVYMKKLCCFFDMWYITNIISIHVYKGRNYVIQLCETACLSLYRRIKHHTWLHYDQLEYLFQNRYAINNYIPSNTICPTSYRKCTVKLHGNIHIPICVSSSIFSMPSKCQQVWGIHFLRRKRAYILCN